MENRSLKFQVQQRSSVLTIRHDPFGIVEAITANISFFSGKFGHRKLAPHLFERVCVCLWRCCVCVFRVCTPIGGKNNKNRWQSTKIVHTCRWFIAILILSGSNFTYFSFRLCFVCECLRCVFIIYMLLYVALCKISNRKLEHYPSYWLNTYRVCGWTLVD